MNKIIKQIQELDLQQLRELIAELNDIALKSTDLSKRFKKYREVKYYTMILKAAEHLEIMTRGY